MTDLLYRKEILRLAADAHGTGRLPEPRTSGEARNPVCGDHVTVDLRLECGKIAAIGFETKACVLTQASASILGRALQGASVKEIRSLKGQVERMLEANGPPPASPFETYSAFEGAVDFPGRHRCVLLPIEAVLTALDGSQSS